MQSAEHDGGLAMTTLTYDDLVTIRALLIERHKEMAATLDRVESMIDQQAYQPITTLNAKTIAAINEPIDEREIAHSIDEFIDAMQLNE